MGTIRAVKEEFTRLLKREVHANAVLVSADDVFEVKNTPSVILQGPTLTENAYRSDRPALNVSGPFVRLATRLE